MAAKIDPEVCYLAWSSTIAIVTDPACILLHYKGILAEQIKGMIFIFLANSLVQFRFCCALDPKIYQTCRHT
jgi:hypothetical protein